MFGPGQRYDVLVCSHNTSFTSRPQPIWVRARQIQFLDRSWVRESRAVMYFGSGQANTLPSYRVEPPLTGSALTIYNASASLPNVISPMALRVRGQGKGLGFRVGFRGSGMGLRV
jgi:hypothetical protein